MKCLILFVALVAAATPATADSKADVESLIAADRSFAAEAAKTDLVSGLSAMMDEEVVTLLPTRTIGHGRAEAVAALRANPANATATMTWRPVGAGVSGDGKHGFTIGYTDVRPKEGAARPGKYVAYWVKQPAGWRVAVYKRVVRAPGDVPQTMMPPVLPEPRSGVKGPAAAQRASLDAAERAFSDNAGKIGVGPAFRTAGSARAVNVGGGPAFTVGADAIGAEVGGGDPKISWAPADVLVARSGDLGVTWGYITPLGQPLRVPYVTIWRREGKPARWVYIAE